jgi:hypothetical protein
MKVLMHALAASCEERETAVFGKWMLIEVVVHMSEPLWKEC